MSDSADHTIPYRRLLSFFVPLGLSASLVTISHVIVNGTLARAADPEATIAAYTVAMSVFILCERPAVLLRQTCSALVKDQGSFRSMAGMTLLLIAVVMVIGTVIGYSPAGPSFFQTIFGVEEGFLQQTLHTYQVLMFVTVFSAVRCLFHGIIITRERTKWLTIGMAIRLMAMYALSLLFISIGWISGVSGALIFLTGMAVEAAVATWEGRMVLREMPATPRQGASLRIPDIFRFYRPLVYSSLIAVVLHPSINVMLGRTVEIELAIASYAIALSVAQLVTSFFSYVHQIVLNFYHKDQIRVMRFMAGMSLIPSALLAVLAFSGAGPWFLENIMGVQDELLSASLLALKVFLLFCLVFPWLDFGNGILMLRSQTRYMVWSQSANVSVALSTLVILTWLVPQWNGVIGAFALSFGFAGELAVVLLAIRHTGKGLSLSIGRGENRGSGAQG